MPKVAALVPAGGVGTRFGARTPKQFLRLGTMPILAATVHHFAHHPAVRAVVVAVPEPWAARARRTLGPGAEHTRLPVGVRGRPRRDSVGLALEAGPGGGESRVVRDGAPPPLPPPPPRRRG